MNTCGKCHFYEPGLTITVTKADESTQSFPGGWCYGAPPSSNNKNSTYPSVREDQRECALWRATPKRGRTK